MNWHWVEVHGMRLFKGATLADSWLATERISGQVKRAKKRLFESERWVLNFAPRNAEGGREDALLLGLKGANLAEMCRMGLPVPPGFTLSSQAYAHFRKTGKLSKDLKTKVLGALNWLELQTGLVLGDADRPLLISVRPGAPVPMPGQMETVLDLGLNEKIVARMAEQSGQEDSRSFAFKSYLRFIQSFCDVVYGLSPVLFEDVLDDYKISRGLAHGTPLSAGDNARVVRLYLSLVETHVGKPFPQDPKEQFWSVIEAAFKNWTDTRTRNFRKINHIPNEWGPAVTVQQMVFGNCGPRCATGFFNTRDPESGRKNMCGRYLPDAQGLDLFLGLKVPSPLSLAEKRNGVSSVAFEEKMPQIYRQLHEIGDRLEKHFSDMQFVEFTVQDGELYVLQTQSAQRNSRATIQVAVDLAIEGLISKQLAVLRVSPNALEPLLHPTLAPDANKDFLTTGIPASPGAASGHIVFQTEDAQSYAARGKGVIFVAVETGPKDVQALSAASGVLTSRGGMTSHAAVMARGMGRPCVTGGAGLQVDVLRETFTLGGRKFKKGDLITIDGTAGEILAGATPMNPPELSGAFATLMSWADSFRRMKVRANAEMPRELTLARRFGAEGLGLCRTEHMFFEPAGLMGIRKMILAEDETTRKAALDQLAELQHWEFTNLFEIMAGLPITVRLFDPPLHEFLPKRSEDIKDLAEKMAISEGRLRRRMAELSESNPMLGHRGCRLAITYPEIPRMQARAIFEASLRTEKRSGKTVQIEIMVPFVAMSTEFDLVRSEIDAVARQIEKSHSRPVRYKVGAMIEVPRAALRTDLLSATADFLSFGTNDLTQMVLGLSRDDAAKFLKDYLSRGIWETDPFVVLDEAGVGRLLKEATEMSREVRIDLPLGVCGEHGGDPESIRYFEALGLDYVSCSPFRVPVARLAAAQASLLKEHGNRLLSQLDSPGQI